MVGRLPQINPVEKLSLEPPFVSIIVPARNEETDIGTCIESLLGLQYQPLEIIAVDDSSSDRTGEILTMYSERVRVIHLRSLPKGWVGKNWACHVGSRYAKGDILLFTDADTVHHRKSLTSAVEYMLSEHVDLLTLWSYMDMRTWWEKVISPVLFHLLFLDLGSSRVNDDDNPDYYAGFGQYLLIRRSVYESIGGHKAVKDATDEDYRIAGRVKLSGFRLRVVDGRRALGTRMYSTFSELWDGWLKNTYEGFDYSARALFVAITEVFALFLLPYIVLAYGLGASLIDGPSPYLALGVLMSVASFSTHLRFTLDQGYNPAYLVAAPLAISVCLAIMVTSLYNGLAGKGRRWKGRLYEP